MQAHQSRIEKLIAELCPDGVEFKKLGELEDGGLIKLGRGNVISKVDISETPGDYPVYSSSAAGNGEIGRYGKYMFEDERISWSIDGGGRLFYRPASKYSITNVSGWLKNLDESKANTKYLYYALVNEWASKIFDYTHKAHPSVIRNEYKIPFPPIGVQREIVKVLDNFTELEAELEAELEVRKKQYEHYRLGLLKFGEGVEFKELGQCIKKNVGGGTPSKAKDEYWGGNIPWASVGDLSVEGIVIRSTRNHITKEGLKNSSTNLVPANTVIVAIKIAPGKMKIADMAITINQDLRGLVLEDFLNPKFLVYYSQIVDVVGHGAIVKSITSKALENIKIPVPTLAEQERIVAILDKFDALVNDISVGLPAEIRVRRQQYEYYRNKLLTFKEYVG